MRARRRRSEAGIGLGLFTGLTSFSNVSTTFDPATLSLTGWWRAAYSGAPWVGTASAGSSANQNATTAAADPTSTSGINGLNYADFDGTNDVLVADDTLDTYFNAGAWTFICLIKVDSTAAAGANATEDEDVFCDGAGTFFAVGVNSSGIRTTVYDGAYKTLGNLAGALGGNWHMYAVKGNGTNIYHAVDADSWSAGTACGNIGNLTNGPVIGKNYDNVSPKHFDGGIAEIITMDSVISDADRDNVRSYFNSRYALSL